MAEEKGFIVELSSRYDGWWRYNTALVCGCFDAAGNRTDFRSAESHIADVGSALASAPKGIDPARNTVLSTAPCNHLMLYIYIVPHTLPTSNDIDSTQPFEAELKISYAGKRLRSEKLSVNQWSGVSIELKIER